MVINIKNTNGGFIERTPAVTQYFTEVRKFEQLTDEQEKSLIKIVKTSPSEYEREEATKRLIEANQRFVIAAARQYAPNDKFLDCVSEGSIGLINALKDFKLEKDVKFITFAAHYVKREITQYLRDRDPEIRKTNISKTFHVASKARNAFIQREQREPTAEELAEILNEEYGLDIKDVSDVADMRLISIDETVSDEEDDACVGDMQLFNDYSACGNGYEKTEHDDFNKQMLSSLFSILTPREQKVISMSFGVGYEKEYEPKEIGVELGLTAERIRQMKKNIIERLQEEFIRRSQMISKK